MMRCDIVVMYHVICIECYLVGQKRETIGNLSECGCCIRYAVSYTI